MAADSNSIEEKMRLRTLFRERRMALTESTWTDLSADIVKNLVSLPTLAHADRIHAFWPIHEKREVDIRPALRLWLAEGRTVWLPVLEGRELLAGRLEAGKEDALRPGPFGLLEPVIDTVFTWDQVQAVIVPGLAVDRNGWRLGYGGGFYDRMLSSINPESVHIPTLCPIFPWERVNDLPHEPHDVKITHVVTS